jgi:hypothetical protein
MTTIQVADKTVTYSTFINDVAEAVVRLMGEPEMISQREAFRRFGRANVERWRKQGKIDPYVRPGKYEYKTSELRRLRDTHQDYF